MEWLSNLFLPRLDSELFQSWPQVIVERFFQVKERETNLLREIKGGVIHFFCTAFILAVNPSLLSGDNGVSSDRQVAVATAISTGISSILGGCCTNLPFVLAPTTATSLYFGLVIQNSNADKLVGNVSVLLLGLLFICCSMNAAATKFISKITPFNIKVGAILGISLLISLEALCQLQVVQRGTRTILTAGEFSGDVYIAFMALVVIGVSLHYQVKGAFFVGIIVATFLYALSDHTANKSWPPETIIAESSDLPNGIQINVAGFSTPFVYKLMFDLFIISVILVDGLGQGLADIAALPCSGTGAGNWLYFALGFGSLLSACLASGPMLLSPESAPGIKAGSKTGLSSVVCGCLYLLTIPFTPVLATLPPAATSPVLLMIALMLFENSSKIAWHSVRESIVVFTMIIIIPFTYSIFNGVVMGITIFIVMYLATDTKHFLRKCRKVLSSLYREIFASDDGVDGQDDVEYRKLAGNDSAEESPTSGLDDDDADLSEDDDGDKALSFNLNLNEKVTRRSSLRDGVSSDGQSSSPRTLLTSLSTSGAAWPLESSSSELPTLTSFDEYRKQNRKLRGTMRI